MNIGVSILGTLVAAGALVATAWHGGPSQPIYQGWVEANFVFIGADEVGRVGTLSVREGDTVTANATLFSVNDDLERAAVAAAGALVASVWHGEPSQPIYQGWVEANFVFIGADEVGRVGTLFVREGDTVTANAPLFTVNDDLERAAVAQEEAALANAQQTFHRAQELVKTGSGTRKEYDAAQSTLSETEARLELGAHAP